MSCSVIILAAGKGSRMKSDKPKVMHQVAGAPMIQYVTASASQLNPEKIVTIIAPDMGDTVGAAVKPYHTAIQHDQNGTGHAVLCAKDVLKEQIATAKKDKNVDALTFIMLGDVPLIRGETLIDMMNDRNALGDVSGKKPSIQLLAMRPVNPKGYGRIIQKDNGFVERIVEDADCTPDQSLVNCVWSGIMAVETQHLFDLLEKVGSDNAQGEIYLTSIIEIANEMGLTTGVSECDTMQVQGVNHKGDLAKVNYHVQQMLRYQHLENGVTMMDPETVYFAIDTQIGADVTIEPNVFFGRGVTVEKGAFIRGFSHLEGCLVQKNAEVGPFARLREGTNIGENAVAGNFVEMKKTTLGKGAKVKHLSYIGNATIGEKANVGAGVITCNYDGFLKHDTTVGAGAFLGVNSVLIAPVTIGDNAMTAAGSVVTKDVEEDALCLARAEQVNKAGFVPRYRAAKQKLKQKK